MTPRQPHAHPATPTAAVASSPRLRHRGAHRTSLLAVATLATLAACGGATGDSGVPDASALDPAREAITTAGLMRHIDVLAADSLEGRAPATVGEERTVRYLTEQFKALGLAPGNPDGTYVQDVSLVGITSRFTADVTRGGSTHAPRVAARLRGAHPLRGPPRVGGRTASSCSWATAWWRPSSTGTTTRAWT